MIKGDSLGSRRSRSSRSESFTESLLVRQRSYSTPVGKTAYFALINVVEDVNTTKVEETECLSVDNKDHKDSGGELRHCGVIRNVEGNQVCFTEDEEDQERESELVNEGCDNQNLSSKESSSVSSMSRGDASGEIDSIMADHERNTSDDDRNEHLDEQTNEEREGDVTEETDEEIVEERNEQADDNKTQEMVSSCCEETNLAETSENEGAIVRSPSIQERIMFFNTK